MRMARMLLLACVMGALVAAGGGTAHAASSSPEARPVESGGGVQAGCYPENAIPEISNYGTNVRAKGMFFNCSGYPLATMELQWHRWWGWQRLAGWSGTWVPGRAEYLWFNCAGTGTHTFRTIMYGRRVDGTPWSRTSGERRLSC